MTAAREQVLKWWNEAWTDGLWAASWSKSVEGLTAQQAAWRPPATLAGQRHSIWQLVQHMIFWREVWLVRATGKPNPTTPEVLAKKNFPEIVDVSEAAWAQTRERFAKTQAQVGEVLAKNLAPSADPVMYFVPHDSYHIGQINMLRGMQGLKPIE